MEYYLGIDIGSTTAKLVLLRDDEIIEEIYERHFSQVREKCIELLKRVAPKVGENKVHIAISGSAGLGLAQEIGIDFVQEVYAEGEVVKRIEPDTSCVIELGGEDAKMIFFEGGTDERMNGSCAGGTGAFIDQMATLLDVTPQELDRLSLNYTRYYPIASRCGVFAKQIYSLCLTKGQPKRILP